MVALPLALKMLVPGYKAKWQSNYAGFIAEYNRLTDGMTFGDEDGTPWVALAEGPRFYGFYTEVKNLEARMLIEDRINQTVPASHFRLVKDVINRYCFPHMRPDLHPVEETLENLFGFHGQHKDCIRNIADETDQNRLIEAFRPKPGELIIDCGPFMGFGELHMSPLIEEGHIFAVEASSHCFAMLQKNLGENDISNVTAMHNGVWKDGGFLELNTAYAQGNSLVEKIHNDELYGDEDKGTERVETKAVDQIVQENGLTRVDMLSLTLNGAEIEALIGAHDTLRNLRPRVRLAGWYERDGQPIWSATETLLKDAGYQVWVGYRGNVMALPVS